MVVEEATTTKKRAVTPEEIVKYFTDIFPKLLIETWKLCLKEIKVEKALKDLDYYHTECPLTPHCVLHYK